MIRKDASPTVKRRLKHNQICPLCGAKIGEYEDFQYLTYPVRSAVYYAFFHTLCLERAKSVPLEKGANYGKEEVKAI